MDELILKPCPFCGVEAALLYKCNYEETAGEKLHYVRCNCCSAETGWYSSEDRAIEMWNRRTDKYAEAEKDGRLKCDWHRQDSEYNHSCQDESETEGELCDER